MKKDRLSIITTVVCLLPMILSAVLYNKLPGKIAIHWNSAGVADNYAPKAFAVFGLPVLMAAFNVFLHFSLNNDPKKANASGALKYLVKWTCPVISVIILPITLFIALGYAIRIEVIVPVIVGVIFVAIGNYLPKCKQSYTVGIKLPWTLNCEANWNKTHHLAGYLWIAGGICMVAGSYIRVPGVPLTLVIVLAMVVIPFIYSYTLYKKGI